MNYVMSVFLGAVRLRYGEVCVLYIITIIPIVLHKQRVSAIQLPDYDFE